MGSREIKLVKDFRNYTVLYFFGLLGVSGYFQIANLAFVIKRDREYLSTQYVSQLIQKVDVKIKEQKLGTKYAKL